VIADREAVNVRVQPNPIATRLFTVDSGQQMEVLDQRLGTDNQRWFEVRFTVEGVSEIEGGWVRGDLVRQLQNAPCPALGASGQ
jgi:hypothetical protein